MSDSVAAGDGVDKSGPALAETLEKADFEVTSLTVVADGVDNVADSIRSAVENFSGLVVLTGGTGFGPRDCTPEASRLVLERLAPGIDETMRAAAPQSKGCLNRGVSGTIKECLVVSVSYTHLTLPTICSV